MAKIELSALVNNIKGSISGTTFQNSQGGLIARRKPFPYNSISSNQSDKRRLLFNLQNNWANFTSDIREEWKVFSQYYKIPQKNNKDRILNGQQIYIVCNTNLFNIGEDLIEHPVQFARPLRDLTLTIGQYAGIANVQLSRKLVSDKEYLLFFASFRLSFGVKSSNVNMKIIELTATEDDTIYNLNPVYNNIYGVNPGWTKNIKYKWKLISKFLVVSYN